MRRFALLALLLALFAAILAPTVACAADDAKAGGAWPQWRGPNRDGVSTETGLKLDWTDKAPELVYMTEGMGAGYAGVSISGNRLYTTGNFDKGQGVVAVDVTNGQTVWKKVLTTEVPKHGYEGSRCTPTVDGERLYVVLSDGTFACVSTTDGEIVWQKDFEKDWNGKMMSGWGFSESPLVDGPWVLATPGGKDAMIVALDKTTGAEAWRSAMPGIGDKGGDGAGYSSIVISNGAGVKQYVQLVGRGVIGVRAKDGKFLWGYNGVANSTANIPTPVVKDDFVFTSTGYGAGSALLKLEADGDGVKASEVYFKKGEDLQNHHGGFVLVGDYIYMGKGHNNGFPVCVKMSTGETVWDGKRGPGSGSAAVMAVDGHVIFRYQSGEVALIEATPEKYNLKGVFKPEVVEAPSWAHPVVVDGRMYLREQNKLMCYKLK